MIPVSLGLMILPLVEVFSPWLDGFGMGLPVWARAVGLVGFAVAVAIYVTSTRTGKVWEVRVGAKGAPLYH
jgi:hypothetical protein